MKEPTRLIHDEGSALERLFLAHAGQEEPEGAALSLLLAPLSSPVHFGADGTGSSGPAPAIEAGVGHLSTPGGVGAASIQPGALSTLGPLLAWSGAGVLLLGLVALGIGRLTEPLGTTDDSVRDGVTLQRSALASRADAAQKGNSEQESGHAQPAQFHPAQLDSKQVDTSGPFARALVGQEPPSKAPHSTVSHTDTPTTQSRLGQGQAQTHSGPSGRASTDVPPRTNERWVARGEVLPPDRATQSVTPQASSSLHDELALLEQVRAALRAKQAETALRRLSRYDERFPNGELREEALVLRMEALNAAGQEAALSELRTQFLVDHPDSPHKARIENTTPKR